MITSAYGDRVFELYGLSTDTKPTDVGNGSTFVEMDTTKVFMFSAESKEWLELS